jgi:ribonuclease P protein component
VVVPKHKHTIVERNLVKRRIREALRREILPQLEADGRMRDVLVRARREAYGVPYETLRDELTNWLERQWSHGRSSS